MLTRTNTVIDTSHKHFRHVTVPSLLDVLKQSMFCLFNNFHNNHDSWTVTKHATTQAK